MNRMVLPSEAFLLKLFNHFNKVYWANSLPTATIQWNHYITNAGRCYKSLNSNKEEYEIILSWKYHIRYPSELIVTLKHEMIHINIPDHDNDFIKECNRIGTRIYSLPFEIPSKYKYRCRICRNTFYEDKFSLFFICPICIKKGYNKENCILEFEGMRCWKINHKGDKIEILPTID